MVNIIKAEHQKAKRTMRKKFIWGFPLLTFVMAFIFTLGMTNAYAESVWNWWYTLLLPGMIALFCYLSVAQEKKIKYYHLMTIPTDRRKLLLGKIIYIGYMILFSNVIVFAVIMRLYRIPKGRRVGGLGIRQREALVALERNGWKL